MFICTQSADMHQAMDSRLLTCVYKVTHQLHMNTFKTCFVPMQDSDKMNNSFLPTHQ